MSLLLEMYHAHPTDFMVGLFLILMTLANSIGSIGKTECNCDCHDEDE